MLACSQFVNYTECMNKPFNSFIRIVATDGKAYPLAAAPIVPASNGAAATPSPDAPLANTMRVNSAGVVFAPVEAAPATFFGPPTTSRMDGAGGAFNDWDCKIAKALARGDFKAVDELKQARADINIKLLQTLEPVWVPTESQLAIGMMMRVAAVEGVCTLHTQAMQSREAY